MTALVATPFITIASNLSSHRAAQGVIYADQIRQSGKDVTVNMTLDFYHHDFNKFDELYVYHGNDWSGHLNLFGGLKEFPYIDNFVNFSKFKGKVYSLMIPHPDYYADLQHKMKLMKEKNKEINPMWDEVDWPNLQRMISTAEVVNPNELVLYDKAAMGDSHAICMYRPGWMLNSVPFKTLHGALKMGLKSFFPTDKVKFTKLEYYFGNIDIRHHLMRQPDPEAATRQIVADYFGACTRLFDEEGLEYPITIYEPLPIENESRSIPKTGWYEGTPFYGTWDERDNIRNIFIDEAIKQQNECVKLFRWCDKLKNNKGELDFKYMEKPQSVHLSREYYPHWQGREYNEKKQQANTVMGLFA